jgi:two-component SAPR family response regulator
MSDTSIIHRVLIVEDEYYLATDLEVALRSENADVVGPICHLSDALHEIDKGRFDAAVIDINLQGEFAYDLADKLKSRGIPFVFATGYSPDAIPSRFSDVVRFQKPFEPACIAKRILQLCGSH